MVKVDPVVSFSHAVSGPELNYRTHDKGLLAIVAAFNTWRHYLESPHHVIDAITDHRNRQRYLRVVKLSSSPPSTCLFALGLGNPVSLTRRAGFYLKMGDRDYCNIGNRSNGGGL